MNINVFTSFPLISCLCVSRNRPELLRRSMDLFRSQAYTNKEMIVVFYEEDEETRKVSKEFRDENIRFYEKSKDSNLTLGDLRNFSVSVAEGEYIAIFDDDDYHSPERLVKQFIQLNLSQKDACSLARLGIYDCVKGKLGISHKRDYGWEGSLMCKTNVMKENLYLSLNKQEDTKVIDELGEKDLIHVMDDFLLYTYFFHTNNTSGRKHLNKLWDKNYKAEPNKLITLEKKIQKQIELHKSIM